MVDGERGHFLHIQPVDILLEQTKQGKVQRGQPGLLALKKQTTLSTEFLKSTHARYLSQVEMQEMEMQREGSAYFGGVAVVERVLHHQVLQHVDGYLSNLPELLQSCTDLPEQQPDQEVVLTEVICQRVIHLEV